MGCGAVGSSRSVQTAIAEDAEVAGAAIGFDAIVGGVGDCRCCRNRWRQAGGAFLNGVGRAIGIAVGGDVNAVVPIGDVVVGYDVALAVTTAYSEVMSAG